LVKAMQGKPVKFMGIGSNMTPTEAIVYQRTNGLKMTIFADNLGLMQQRYGFKISLQNIWQFRIIDAEGKVQGFNLDEPTITQVIDRAKTDEKYLNMDLDAKFVPVLDLLEFGQHAVAMKQVLAFKKTAKKNDLVAVNAIHDAVKKDAETSSAEAEGLKESEPIKARDLYAKIAASLPTDNLGKTATASMKKLDADKNVKAELTARTAYQQLVQKMSMLAPQQATQIKPALAHAFAEIVNKHTGTPTAARAQALVDELGGDPTPPKKK
jgi:hypothetical protein